MTEVFVLIEENPYDSDVIMGVFSSQTLAEARQRELVADSEGRGYYLIEQHIVDKE